MAALSICRQLLVNKMLGRSRKTLCRLISTSEGKKEANDQCTSPETLYKKVPDFSKPLENKNWVSYGFSKENEEQDRLLMHVCFFTFISLVMGGWVFMALYLPDKGRVSWAQREAFIRLYEREQLGLPAIDPNYVDPSKIVLPPDEDLAEEDITV